MDALIDFLIVSGITTVVCVVVFLAIGLLIGLFE